VLIAIVSVRMDCAKDPKTTADTLAAAVADARALGMARFTYVLATVVTYNGWVERCRAADVALSSLSRHRGETQWVMQIDSCHGAKDKDANTAEKGVVGKREASTRRSTYQEPHEGCIVCRGLTLLR
jgi:hypothetical protein